MKYTTVLLPGFEYEKIKGAVNPNKISVRLDSDRYQVRSKLKQIKMKLEEEFKLSPKPEERWDEKVDEFIEEVNKTAKEIDVEDYNKTLLTQQKYSSMFDDMIDILRIEQDGWV